MIDFDKLSLALVSGKDITYSSQGSGLRPLFICVSKFKGKVSGCILYDRVIGLAAARLIVYSGIISEVVTPVASAPAKELLQQEGIRIKAGKVVDNILMKDGSDICPMEKKAKDTGNQEMFEFLKKRLSKS